MVYQKGKTIKPTFEWVFQWIGGGGGSENGKLRASYVAPPLTIPREIFSTTSTFSSISISTRSSIARAAMLVDGT
jgi:hypothetical protein